MIVKNDDRYKTNFNMTQTKSLDKKPSRRQHNSHPNLTIVKCINTRQQLEKKKKMQSTSIDIIPTQQSKSF